MSYTSDEIRAKAPIAASEATAGDYIALLKPRVMSLVVFTGFVGYYLAPASPHPVLAGGSRVGENPWGEGATTLEWQVASPPPFHTYEELPRVK